MTMSLSLSLSLPHKSIPLLCHSSSSSSATALAAAAAAAAQRSPFLLFTRYHSPSRFRRHFHQTHAPRTFKPVWTEARVKTPWVEALAQKKKEKKEGEQQQQQNAVGAAKSGGSVDLTPRKMQDSYYRTILPLAQDPWLLDTYLNATGHIRLGSLLMDLDALAGVVAYRHAGDSVALVTAAVDRITIEHPLKEICDLELSGQVTYATGRSSMEVSLQVAKAPESPSAKVKPEDVLITCAFTMVSLDPVTKKPAPVPALAVDNADESRVFEQGQRNYNAKKALRKISLREETPNDEESDLIHSMWTTDLAFKDPTNPQQRPKHVVYMTDTTLRSAQIMQPEYRNRHNFMIFGGYLLKQTFELAFCCAASFSHRRPSFLCLDPSTFDNPVPVGSVLYLKATVAYTDPPLISSSRKAAASNHSDVNLNQSQSQTSGGDDASTSKKYTRVQVRVDSSVRDVEHDTKRPTGVFNYTFLVERDIQVMPQSYEDFMVWVDARRRAQNTNASLNLPGSGLGEGVTE